MDDNCLRIIYFGDGGWGQNSFDQIISHTDFQIEKVILRYDNPDEVLRKKAEKAGIDVLCPENINNPAFIDQLTQSRADLGVSMSYNQILKRPLINIFPKGVINCHAGCLPEYRGRNVLNWALINGEKEIGVTCHFIDEGIDTGDIISQKAFPISPQDDYRTVLNKAYNLCTTVLIDGMEKIKDENVSRRPQPKIGSYFIERKNGDEFIDWSWSSERIYNFVRAITAPGPYARSWIHIAGEYHLILIKKVDMVQGAVTYNCIPGGVVGKTAAGEPLVKTGDTIITFVDYEIDHYNTRRLKIGDRLGINFNLFLMEQQKQGEK